MASVWRLHCHRTTNGHRHFRYQKIFHLYFLSNARFARYFLLILCLLDEHKKLHSKIKAQPAEIFISTPFFYQALAFSMLIFHKNL